jgi:hypothetical protein
MSKSNLVVSASAALLKIFNPTAIEILMNVLVAMPAGLRANGAPGGAATCCALQS